MTDNESEIPQFRLTRAGEIWKGAGPAMGER